MFHTFLHPIGDFSGGASTAVGIDLPPIAAIANEAIDVDRHSSLPLPPVQASAQSGGPTTLEAWLDDLPMRGWDA